MRPLIKQERKERPKVSCLCNVYRIDNIRVGRDNREDLRWSDDPLTSVGKDTFYRFIFQRTSTP